MKYVLLLIGFIPVAIMLNAQSVDDFNSYLTNNRQVLFVKTAGDTSTRGTLVLYERKNNNRRWKRADSFAVVVGRSGLARDANNSISFPDLSVKKEGDGKSPAGIFALGDVFSYHPVTHLRMPFKQVDTSCYCVDDAASVYYNTLIVKDTAKQAYNSFEHMKRNDDFYEYGVWVLYNSQPVIPGNGSCIFLHVWKDENSSTSGCTAMSKTNIISLIHWLSKKKNPVLLQMVAEQKSKHTM